MRMILPLQKRRPIIAGNKVEVYMVLFIFFVTGLLYYHQALLRRTLVRHTIM